MNTNRRNQHRTPAQSRPPYNEIWEAFKSILDTIFSDRLPEGQRNDAYISNPEIESQIESYINSDTTQVAIVHGLMGSGKSTLLEHFVMITEKNESQKAVYINFQGRRYHLIPELDYYKASREERREIAKLIVTKRLNELLLTIVSEYRSFMNENFFEYLRDNYLSEIGVAALFADSEEKRWAIIEKFMTSDDHTAAVQCFIRYISGIKKFERFVIFVDNVDEQSLEIVEGIFFALSDFLDCLNRPKKRIVSSINGSQTKNVVVTDSDTVDIPTKFKSILACRSNTLEALNGDHEGILPTRGYKEILIDHPSMLTAIVKKRVELCRKRLSEKNAVGRVRQDLPYVLKTGASVRVEDALGFIETFVTRLASATAEGVLFNLFNRNYARSLQCMRYIVQNRYFVVYDADVLSKGQIVADFHYTRALKALSYGNPLTDEELFYPSKSSVISNIFIWDTQELHTFLLVIRLLKWFEMHASGAGYHSIAKSGDKIENVIRTFDEKYGINSSAVKIALQICHENGLIFAGSGHHAGFSMDEAVCISPKGSVHLAQIFRDTTLFEILIDDIPMPLQYKDVISGRPPVVKIERYPTRVNFLDTMKWLNVILKLEHRLLEDVRRKDVVYGSNMLDLFGGKLISGLLGGALLTTFDSYYESVCNQDDRRLVDEFILMCKHTAMYFR